MGKNVFRKGMVFGIAILLTGISPILTQGKTDRLILEDSTRCMPSSLQLGDLFFFDVKQSIRNLFHLPPEIEGFSNDHVAMYIGGHRFIESIDYSFFGAFDYLDGVQITPWWVFALFVDYSTITIGKVNASFVEKIHAICFALKQLNEPYQYAWMNFTPYHSWHANPDLTNPANPFYEKYNYPDDPYVDYWTCAEFVWASYLHQGINLDSTAYPHLDSTDGQYYYYVGPDDILNSENITLYPSAKM